MEDDYQGRIDTFMLLNGSYFHAHHVRTVRQRLSEMTPEEWSRLDKLQLKNPLSMLLVSLLGGTLGIDRFVLGDTGLGVAKLLTCGGLGIWTIVDWFMVMDNTREKNMEQVESELD